jgi:holo-[acyl-carrier protein] synthase
MVLFVTDFAESLDSAKFVLYILKCEKIPYLSTIFYTEVWPLILGIGTDVFDVQRMADELDNLKDILFTSQEIAYCDSQHHPASHYAVRYAAKEALVKALGSGLRGDMNWQQMEIVRDDFGAPHFNLSGAVEQAARQLNVARIFVSLSHTPHVAAATVVLES